MPTPSRRLWCTKCVYIWVLLLWLVHFPKGALGSWAGRRGSRLVEVFRNMRRFVRGRHNSEGASQRHRTTESHDAQNPEAYLTRLYHRLLHSRDSFSAMYEDLEKKEFCEEAVNEGPDALRYFLSLPMSRQGETESAYPESEAKMRPDPCVVFPCGRPLMMISATRKSAVQYTVVKDEKGMRVFMGPSEQGYHFEMCETSGKDSGIFPRALDFTDLVEEIVGLRNLFNVGSLDEVERIFRVMTLKDILIHPSKEEQLTFPGGAFFNYVLLYKPTISFAGRLVPLIEEARKSSYRNKLLAEIAKLSLTVQVIHLLGRIFLRGVVLCSLEISHFRVDGSGQVYVESRSQPRKKETQQSLAFPTSTPTTCDYEGRQKIDFHTNSKTGLRLLSYLWCPSAAKQFPPSTPTAREVQKDAQFLRCLSMPRELREISENIVTYRLDMSDALFSTAYVSLHLRLRRALEERHADT